jgi:hypothetical protein
VKLLVVLGQATVLGAEYATLVDETGLFQFEKVPVL